ncbi:MAG: serine/threonine-protein kinase [Myxococcaceae bacterium]
MSELVFGKYEIQHRIAIGGMGEVFYAMQRGVSGFERPVILKSLLPDLAQQQDLVNQFLDEARVAATLNHPNVVSIFEVGLWNGTFYIAMEYIRGRNLAQLLRRSVEQQVRIPPQVTARIIREAAAGLDHAHRAHDANGNPLNIVHRDISPQNIMLREDGVAKVVDFGIASAANRSTRTATGTLKGKLAYMAPEQVLSEPMTPKVDQFALGIVFWEMLCTRRLFKADNDVVLIKSVLEAEIPRPETLSPDVPPGMSDVVMKMLDRDPERRFGSLGEVADALEAMPATSTGQTLSAAALMKKLGTDDLKVEVKRSTSKGDNFVISLNEGRATPGQPEGDDVDLSTRTGVSPKGAKRGVVVPVVSALAVLAFGAVAVVRSRPASPKDPPPAVVPVPVAPVIAEPPPVVDAGPAPIEALADATLEIKVTPPDAVVRLDGRPLDVPATVKVSPHQVHYLLAEATGYERAEEEIAALAPGATKDVLLTLKRRVRTGKNGPKEKDPPPPPPPLVTNPTPSAPGFLTINTTPWTKVSIDGDLMGSTPLAKLKLAPGPHQIVFVNEGENINVVRSVTIAPGESQKLQLKLP